MNRIFFILPHNILSFNKNCFIHDYLLEPDRIIIKRKNLHFFFFFNRNNDLLTYSQLSILRWYLRFLRIRNNEWNGEDEAIRSRFIVVRGDRLTNNNPGDSALTSSRKIRSEATLYCSRNCMQRHSFRLGTRIHRA